MDHFYQNRASNFIYENNIHSGKATPLYQIKFMSKPKTVYTPSGRVFVIGGHDTQEKVTGKCYEIVNKTLHEIAPLH